MADGLPIEQKTDEDRVDRLERQVERGGLFTHTAVSRNADRIHEAESFLYGLIDTLIEKGLLTPDEVSRAAEKVRREMAAKGETVGPGIALRVDGADEGTTDFVPVNCAERYHICKAVCCRLHFALSAEEVESGMIKWDLGEPYYIRQDSKGCCHHLDQDSGRCTIYENRPGTCRQYSCANDGRIWKDFDNMVLNEEWISEHLGERQLRLVALQMVPQSIASQPVASDSAPDDESSAPLK